MYTVSEKIRYKYNFLYFLQIFQDKFGHENNKGVGALIRNNTVCGFLAGQII